MTVTVTPAPAPAPSRADPINFSARADAYHAWLPGAVNLMNAQNAENNTLNASTNAQAAAAAASATTAAGHATTAQTHATAAAASLNFKGAWSSLTGALNVPSTVSHLGRTWMLLNNLANVTTSVPGTDTTNWLAVSTPTRPDLRPSLSVDWTQKPTAAALTAAGWTISRASEMTYFGPVPVKVAENLLVNSRNIAAWNLIAVTQADVTDESGLVGRTVVATATTGYHGITTALVAGTYLASANYRLRYLAKAGAQTKAVILDGSQGRAAAAFDLATGAIIGTGYGPGYISHSITPHELGGGLYWCELVLTSSASGGWSQGIGGYPDSGATLNAFGAQYTGDGTSGIEVYAAQLQQGFDGPWIESTTQPVTLYEKPLLTAASGELAYQHNDAGECLGLLSYPAATNVCLQSQNLAHASWSKVGVSVTQTKRLWAGVAPFFSVAKTTISTYSPVIQACFTPVAGSVWSATVALMGDVWSGVTSADFALTGTTNGIFGGDSHTAAAILSGPGTLSKAMTGAMHRITGLSYTVPTLVRITRTYPLAESAASSVGIYPDTFASTTIGKAILATRVQVESGPRATPYIPTTSATVTRATQTVSLGGSAFAAANNPAQGTLLARASWEDLVLGVSTSAAVGLNNGSNASVITLASNSSSATTSYGLVRANAVNGHIAQINGQWGTAPNTHALAFSTSFAQHAAGGSLAASGTPLKPFVDRLSVGSNTSYHLEWAGLIQRTELYPRAMTASELQAITTPGVL